MGVPHNLAHQVLRIKDHVLLLNHATSNSHDRTEDTNIEKHGAMRRDFEVQEEVGVEE